jgi:hypothetical protein
LRAGAGQEVVAKSPLTSDWHAPETGRAAVMIVKPPRFARARARENLGFLILEVAANPDPHPAIFRFLPCRCARAII